MTLLLRFSKKMNSKQFRVLIYHCFLMGKNTITAKAWLDKCYPDSAPSRQTVEKWFADFKRGRTDTDDAERSGRPIEVVTPENIKKVHRIVSENRKPRLLTVDQKQQRVSTRF